MSVLLIVGLGNPGREYRNNRHNAGFIILDRLAKTLEIRFTRMQSRALVAQKLFEDKKIILAKPQTFMNLSGQSVGGLARFYKLPIENILVVHDDLDLPLGIIRLRPKGGSGGQKGLMSIIERLGAENFSRLRVGIGRPSGNMDSAAYVLQDFSAGEMEIFDQVATRAVEAVLVYIQSGLDVAMNQFNGNQNED